MTVLKRKFPVGFAVGVLVVLLGIAAWLGLRSKAVALDEQIERRLDTLAEMNVVASKLGELEKVKHEMSVRVNGARGQLLDVPEDKAAESQTPMAQTQLNEIFSTLAEDAGLTGVTIKYPSVGKLDEASPFQLVTLNASMRCDEKQFTQILLGLANHKKLLPVTELRITSNWRNPKLPVLTVDITIGGYYRPNIEEGG